MEYVLEKSDEVKLDMWKLGIIFLFAVIILQPLLFPRKNYTSKKITEPYGTLYPMPYAMHKNKKDYYPKNSSLLFANNKCCKSCCKQLWPLPFDVNDCPTCVNNNEQYVLSNYTCQGENGSGCVCVNKNEADFLDGRGNNRLFNSNINFPHDAIEPTIISKSNIYDKVVNNQIDNINGEEVDINDQVYEEGEE